MLLGIKVNLPEMKVDLYGLPHDSMKCKYIKYSCINAIQFHVKLFCQALHCPENQNTITLYTLRSVCIFSILFSIHFLRC